jgi:hypothetical protein
MFWTGKLDALENFLALEPVPEKKKAKRSSSITKNKKR